MHLILINNGNNSIYLDCINSLILVIYNIPLFNKSNYTLLSSLLKIEDIISYAKTNNLPSIALSDNNMFGTMEFYKKCQKEGIKPIIGLQIDLNEKEFVLYAKDYLGYKNLLKLSTIQSERKVLEEDLKKYNNNLIGIIPFYSKELWDLLGEIYLELYLGYSKKEEEMEAKVVTNNTIFFQKNLLLKKFLKKLSSIF